MLWYILTAGCLLVAVGSLVVAADPVSRAKALALSGGSLALWLVVSAFFVWHSVPAGHVGLVKAFGAYKGVKEPGLVATWPWQGVETARVRNASHKLRMDGGGNGSAASRESQAVFVVATLNYSIEPGCVRDLYTNYGSGYYETIIEPRAKQIFKAETVKFSAVAILPNREAIRADVQRTLDRQLRGFCIRGLDFLLDNVGFGKQFGRAIEEKQVATQQAAAAENRVEVAKQEAQQQIEKARGEAESKKKIADAEAYANRVRRATLTPLLAELERIQRWQPEIIYLPSNDLLLQGGRVEKPVQR